MRLEEEEDESALWYEGCRYRCSKCPAVKKDGGKMGAHLKQAHGVKRGAEQRRAYCETLRETFFACRLCGVSVLRMSTSVHGHLKRRHQGLSIHEYRNRYMLWKARCIGLFP